MKCRDQISDTHEQNYIHDDVKSAGWNHQAVAGEMQLCNDEDLNAGWSDTCIAENTKKIEIGITIGDDKSQIRFNMMWKVSDESIKVELTRSDSMMMRIWTLDEVIKCIAENIKKREISITIGDNWW